MFTDKLRGLLRKLTPYRTQYITVSLAPKELPEARGPVLPEKLPRHVAIIMDGNGRWAQNRGLPRSAGHAAGTEALRDIIRACDDWGIAALTIYAFSTENWVRPKDEVNTLMGLLLRYFSSEIDELHEKNVRIRIIGDIDGMPEAQREAIRNAMTRTRENTGLRLNIALNYGGREDLVHAAQTLAQRAAAGELKAEDITSEMMESCLRSEGLGDVDLLIRTSGEVRLSNFLPWQLAYAEMVFDRTLWPDYDRQAFLRDLEEYAARSRRYGGVGELEDSQGTDSEEKGK